MDNRLYMVVNIEDAALGGHPAHPEIRDCYYLEHRYRPSIIYWYREDAEREAERLAASGTRGEFAVMETTCIVRTRGMMPCGPLKLVPVYERFEE